MSDPKPLLIVNPVAGKGRAGERLREIEASLSRRGLVFELALTKAPWHAAELARAAAREGRGHLVVAGGDGTFNEVINGLLGADSGGKALPSLGFLSVGRGNDFAYGLGLPLELEEAAALVAEAPALPFDVGLVRGGDYPEGRYFGNGLGIGFDALVGFEAAKMRHVHGPLAYSLGAAKIFARFPEAPELRVSAEDFELAGPCHQISVMNGSRMGGSYHMAPGALPDDGKFDLCVVGKTSRLEMGALILRYLKGSQAGHPKVRMARSSRVLVEAPQGGLAVHADGETICKSGYRVEIECLKGVLRANGLGSKIWPDGPAAGGSRGGAS